MGLEVGRVGGGAFVFVCGFVCAWERGNILEAICVVMYRIRSLGRYSVRPES